MFIKQVSLSLCLVAALSVAAQAKPTAVREAVEGAKERKAEIEKRSGVNTEAVGKSEVAKKMMEAQAQQARETITPGQAKATAVSGGLFKPEAYKSENVKNAENAYREAMQKLNAQPTNAAAREQANTATKVIRADQIERALKVEKGLKETVSPELAERAADAVAQARGYDKVVDLADVLSQRKDLNPEKTALAVEANAKSTELLSTGESIGSPKTAHLVCKDMGKEAMEIVLDAFKAGYERGLEAKKAGKSEKEIEEAVAEGIKTALRNPEAQKNEVLCKLMGGNGSHCFLLNSAFFRNIVSSLNCKM